MLFQGKVFSEIYDLLDVHIIERGESFYRPSLERVIEDFEKKNLSRKDAGATCVFYGAF